MLKCTFHISKQLNYLNITVIIDAGKSSTISIGICPGDYPDDRQPGWNAESIGYHADDGG